ncbi:MAG: hypothetical protein ACP5JP_10650 [bacterium]
MRKGLLTIIIVICSLLLSKFLFTGGKVHIYHSAASTTHKIRYSGKYLRTKHVLQSCSEKTSYIRCDKNNPDNDLIDDQDGPDISYYLLHVVIFDTSKQIRACKIYLFDCVNLPTKGLIRRC